MHPVVSTIATSGSAGSATGQGQIGIAGGRLLAVEVDLAAGQPNTIDVAISNNGRALLTLTNMAADRVVQPRVPAQDGVGVDIAGSAVPPFAHGNVDIAITGANAAPVAAIVRLFFE